MRNSSLTETIQEERPGDGTKTNVEVKIPLAGTSISRNRIGIILSIISLYFIWGSTYLGMRIGLEGFPPFLLGGIRFLIAGGILYTILRIRGTPAPTRKQWAGAAL